MPYSLGIASALTLSIVSNVSLYLSISVLCLSISYFYQKHSKPNRTKQWVYLFFVNVFLFLLAHQCCWLYQERNNQAHYNHFKSQAPQSFIGTINELPVTNEKFIKVPFQIQFIETSEKWSVCEGKTVLYIKNDSTKTYQVGEQLLVQAEFSYVQEPKNPNEFNYKQFLERKNNIHVVYAKPQQIKPIPSISYSFSFVQLGVRIKQGVVTILREADLSQEAFSICTALLVGYDDEIDQDVMQSFAHSGTLHVLSVSGMHTGLLYGLIVWLFSLFDKHEKQKIVKCVVVLLSLFLFTLITGFTPSVLRASIMLSFIVIGNTFYKNGNNYNTLFLSAFVMLLFNPYLIVDIGFQLSYLAVFGIMYFYPQFQQWYVFNNRFVQWCWSLTLLSVSATITTLPISLWVFHQFPIWFALSNLIIIPLSTVLMALSGALLVLSKIAFLKTGIVYLMNSITSIMLWIANLTNKPNYGFIDNLSFSTVDACFLAIVILLMVMVFATKQFKHVLWLGSILIAWLSYSIVINYKQLQQAELLVFHIKHKSLLALRKGKTIYMDSTLINSNEYSRYVKPYLLDYSGHEVIQTKANYFEINNQCVLLNKASLPIESPLQANYIIVSNNKPLNGYRYNSKQTIIADCSNSYTFAKQLKQQCQKQGLLFYDVREKEAFKEILNDK